MVLDSKWSWGNHPSQTALIARAELPLGFAPSMAPISRALAAAGLLAAVARAQVYQLVLLNTTAFPNAVALDGTPGGFWWLPGAPGTRKFVVHHQGGGWCTSLDDCLQRSQTTLGSSRFWADANCSAGSSQAPCSYDGGTHGYFSVDPAVNPLFADAHHVYIAYGDGASYSGRVAAPVPIPGQPAGTVVHFKGAWVLEAVYATLLSPAFGMAAASDVLIGGTSAGGLSVYLTIDRIARQVRDAAAAEGHPAPRVTGAPDAGFFLDAPSFAGPTVYTPLYQWVAAAQNVSGSVNDACVAHYAPTNDAWRCILAQYTLPFVATPLFVANSLSDAWQGENIMALGCTPSKPGSCSAAQLAYLAGFGAELLRALLSSLAPASAAWLPECWVHPLMETDHYFESVAVGGDTMGSLFARWYAAGPPPPNATVPLVRADAPVWGANAC